MTYPWFTNATVADALQEARALGRPILLDLWSPTCKGCAKLLATTYQSSDVRAWLAERFICIKYDTKKPDEWFRRLNGRFAHLWHPDLVVLDANLTEVRRIIGYFPPRELIAHLSIGYALVELYRNRAAKALEILEGADAGAEGTTAAPEILYWAGVAALRAGGGLAALAPRWERLRATHPSSQWAVAADCLDVDIPEGGFDGSDPSSVRVRDGEMCCT